MSKSTVSTTSACLSAVVLALIVPIAAISAPLYPAHPVVEVADNQTPLNEYYVKVPIWGYQNSYTGDFEMCVRIFQKHDRGYVSVWNFMPDSGQYLVIKVAPLYKLPSAKLEFRFAENEEVGSIEYPDANHIRVDLETKKPAESMIDSNIMRQYGVNVLPKAPCPADRNPETFGGGHAAWPPER